MAIVKNPLSSEDARNKFGPVIVFSGWRAIKVVRSNVYPTNPRTADQLNIRAILANLAAEWTALTKVQTDPWNEFASGRPRRTAFGEFKPSGMNEYVSLNFNRAYNAQASNVAPPTAAFKGNCTTLASVGGGAAGEVDMTWVLPAGAAAADWVRIDVSRQMSSPHEALTESDWRISAYIAGNLALHTITGLVSGGFYNTRIRFVQTDGRSGVPITDLATAT